MASRPVKLGQVINTSKGSKGSQTIPFYTTITNVKEDFITESGTKASVDLPLVTLPAGTVLFRGMRMPDQSKGEDAKYFYRDFLGNPEKDDSVCLSPVHNTFFYPFPYVAFGAHDIGKTFDMMQMVVLVHSVNVVAAISPSSFVRGMGQRYAGTAPWQRCSNFKGPDIDCHTPTFREEDAKKYDNCLNPEYQMRSGTRGWMALADLDSINPKKKRWNTSKPSPMKNSPMGSFLKTLEAEIPGEASKALAWAYTDDHGHAGYPEIALYPYKHHKGRHLITRYCPDDKTAMALIEREAVKDNLNYLPIATFTKSGVVNMITGHFAYKSVSNNARGENAYETVQKAILQNIYGFIDKVQKGISLPHYGESKLSFDTRTGFFVFDKIIPSLNIPIPKEAVQPEAEAQFNAVPYKFLIMPLDTPEAQKRALQYMLIFRNFLPEHFMEKYSFARRAMIFNRYPILTTLFTELGIELPKEYLEPLGRAGSLYRKETGKTIKTGGAKDSNAARVTRRKITKPETSHASLFKSVWKLYG